MERFCIMVYLSIFGFLSESDLKFSFLSTKGYSLYTVHKMPKKKQIWHLCFDSFVWSTQTAAFILSLFICASLLETITKCLYIDGSCRKKQKKMFVKDDRICFYCDVLFTCSSHLHCPHSVSCDIQIVLKAIYVLTSSWRQRAVHFIICFLEHSLQQCKLMVERQFSIMWFFFFFLKKHDCYQKQFMHTNLFLVHKKFTSAFILPIKQNCLQREDKNKTLL